MIKSMNHLMRQRTLNPPLIPHLILTQHDPRRATKPAAPTDIAMLAVYRGVTPQLLEFGIEEYDDGGGPVEVVHDADAVFCLGFDFGVHGGYGGGRGVGGGWGVGDGEYGWAGEEALPASKRPLVGWRQRRTRSRRAVRGHDVRVKVRGVKVRTFSPVIDGLLVEKIKRLN
jgi:hypothetical protein